MPTESRGVRNKNPGNLDRTGTKWQGMAKDQSSDPRFIVFTSPQYGIRAMAKTLLTYQNAHGLNTAREIIGRWAPTVENNTNAYVQAVADELGVDPDQELDVDACETMLALIKAIIRHENGRNPYSDKVILEGMRMAGVHDAPTKSPIKRLVALGGAGCTALGGALTDPEKLQNAQGFLQPVAEVSPILKGLFVMATVGILGLTMLGISKANRDTGGL